MNAGLLFQTGLIQAIFALVRKGSIPDKDIIRSLGESFGPDEVRTRLASLEADGFLYRDGSGFLRRTAKV